MVTIPEPLRASAAQLQLARQAGDASAIAALCTEDALIILPGGLRLTGRQAIAAHDFALPRQAAAGAKSRGGADSEPSGKFYFFPPLAHAVATVNGRHGEKHSVVDIYQQQDDLRYLLVFSSWTLR